MAASYFYEFWDSLPSLQEILKTRIMRIRIRNSFEEENMLEVIKQRRSIRKFNDEALTKEELEVIVEAGRYAPTGGNSQSVHFTVISNPDILAALRIKVQEAFSKMELREDLYKSLQNSIRVSKMGKYVYDYNAPVLIVVSNQKDYANAMADCACALENMMLQATEMNIGSCWINQLHWLDDDAEVREILARCGISAEETVCGSVALGKSDVQLKPLERTGMEVTWIS